MHLSINKVLKKITSDKEKALVEYFLVQEFENYENKLINLNKTITHLKGYSSSTSRKILLATNSFLKKGLLLCGNISSKIVIKDIKRLFRNRFAAFIYKSKLLKHGYYKPAGYPGDHNAIEHVYIGNPISQGIGYYFDLVALKDGYANAIRARKNAMKEKLREFIIKNKYSDLTILNLGAGSCREIRELLDGFGLFNNMRFTLIDQDKIALAFSESKLKRYSKQIKFEYINGNIISICRDLRKFKKEHGVYNMVYSIGLADYIPEYYLEKLITFSFNVLKKGGEIVIAHKDIVTHSSLVSDWMCDWNFIPRSKSEVIRIFKNALKGKTYTIKYEVIKEGRVTFITIVKKQ